MVVAGTDALSHGIGSAARLRAGYAAACKRGRQGLRSRLGITMHCMLNRHLVAELRQLDVNLCDRRTGGDELAPLSGPLREARSETSDEIALADELVCDRRREAATDAKRPRALGKEPVPTCRSR